MTQISTESSQPIMPKTHMALSVVALVLSQGLPIPMVLSIIAIVKASKVTGSWLNQQHTEAYQDSRSAKILGLIALIWAIVVKCLIIVAYVCF